MLRNAAYLNANIIIATPNTEGVGEGEGVDVGSYRRGRRKGTRRLRRALWRFVHEWLLPWVSRSFRATYGTSCHSSRTNGTIASIKEREEEGERERATLCIYNGWSRAAFLNSCLGCVLVFCRRCRKCEKIVKYLAGERGDWCIESLFPSLDNAL